MARKSYISVLQFDERLITRLRVKRSPKGVDVVSYDMQAGSWSAGDGSLAEALQAFAKQYKLADDSVCTVLPRHDMTARILTLPSHSAVETESMVRLSAEEYVPYPAHELVIDQSILQKSGDGSARVLAVFAHRDMVESHVELLRKCAVEPEHIYVSTACLASAAQQARLDEPRYALVNLAAGGLEVLVLQNGRLAYGRGVAMQHDWQALSHADPPGIGDLAVEVRASLAAFRRESEDGEGVDRVFVCSEVADCAAAAAVIEAATGIDCSPATFAQSIFEQGVPSTGIPLVAAGAALAAQDRASLAISLAPASLIEARQAGELRRSLYAGGGLAAAVLLCACAVFAQAYYQRAAYSSELRRRIETHRPVAEEVRTKYSQLLRLQQNLDRRGSALEMLAALTDLVPKEGMTITRFAYSHDDTLTIQGRAESPGLAAQLKEEMRNSGSRVVPQFARAQGGADKQEMEQNRPVYQFEIIVPLAPDEKTDEGGADE